MKKFKLFIENFLVYGLGGIISKLVPLIMVPIVTRIMPDTSYYGLSDLSNTVVSFASAIVVMGMYDAMYRLFFENDEIEYKKSVCSTAFCFTLITSVIVFFTMLLLKRFIAQLFFGNEKYTYLVYVSAMAALVTGTNSIVSAPTRMQNKRKIFLITNTISPLLSYGIAIPILLKGYYIIALPIASVISGILIEISFYVMNKEWFAIKRIDLKKLKSLLIIAIPLFPNFLIYWLFNSSDKIMITNLIGVSYSGIYSVGSKLGHCSQLIYTAFTGGWQYFAFSTMKEKNQVESNSNIFEYLGIISFTITAFVCAWSYKIYESLFTNQYIEGYIISPYLFLAPLLQMLFQVACNQFIIIKKTWPNMLILMGGAVINIIGNFILIPIIGIEGAAISTLLGYLIADIICIFVLYKWKLMTVSKRFLVASFIMIIYMVLWRVLFSSKCLIGTCIAILFSVIMVLFYKKEIKYVISYIKKDTI